MLSFAALAAVAIIATGQPAARLNRIAEAYAGQSIAISVTNESDYQGAAFVGGTGILLSPLALQDAEHGGGVGLFVFLHELGHITGITDEHATDCFSLAHIRPVLRRYWPLVSRSQDRFRYQDALAWPGKYDGNRC